jgi:hypothetical protein
MENKLRFFQTGMLRKIYSPNNLNAYRVIKSSKTRCAGHVTLVGGKSDAHRVLVGKPGEKM